MTLHFSHMKNVHGDTHPLKMYNIFPDHALQMPSHLTWIQVSSLIVMFNVHVQNQTLRHNVYMNIYVQI